MVDDEAMMRFVGSVDEPVLCPWVARASVLGVFDVINMGFSCWLTELKSAWDTD